MFIIKCFEVLLGTIFSVHIQVTANLMVLEIFSLHFIIFHYLYYHENTD
jgi:hypothetical protein